MGKVMSMDVRTGASIKPCPFCGSRAVSLLAGLNDLFADGAFHEVVCCYCKARGPEKATERNAIAAWNERIGA